MTVKGNEESTATSSRDEAGLTPAQRTWLEHMKQSEAEGLTYKAYCSREGLKVGALYAARKVLRERASTDTQTTSLSSPPRFAAVRLAHGDAPGTVQVVLPNGVQIHVALNAIDDVVQLVQSLIQLSR